MCRVVSCYDPVLTICQTVVVGSPLLPLLGARTGVCLSSCAAMAYIRAIGPKAEEF